MNAHVDCPMKVTEPFLRMDPISGERYVSAEYFREEWKRMWMRSARAWSRRRALRSSFGLSIDRLHHL